MSRCQRPLLLLTVVGSCGFLVLQFLNVDLWSSARSVLDDPFEELLRKELATPDLTEDQTEGNWRWMVDEPLFPKSRKPLQPFQLVVELDPPVPQGRAEHAGKNPKIKFSPEELLRTNGSDIAELPVQDPRKVVRVLVIAYFRSGSSFLADVLIQNRGTFFYFEPLHYANMSERIPDELVPDALALLRDLMLCDFSSPASTRYLNWSHAHRHIFPPGKNPFLWEACRSDEDDLCFRPDFLRFVCGRAPWLVAKVNRLGLERVGRFVLENPDLDLRVLHLVRDPRGVICSRKVMDWCDTLGCSDIRMLCSEMDTDHREFVRLKKMRPDRFFQVRYEDLSLNPQTVTRDIFASLGLPYTTSVSKFLKVNTKARPVDVEDPYSTRRDSSRTPFEWTKKMKLNDVRKVQTECSSVLKNLRYAFVKSSEQLTGGDPRMFYSSVH